MFDLLRQADTNYSAINPEKIRLYIKVDGVYQEVTSGYFTAVDKDTLSLDMSSLPNFNGQLEVSVLGTDSTGNGFILDLTVQVTPVNDAPSGADESVALANGDIYVLGLGDFGFVDAVEGNGFRSVVIDSVPAGGVLHLDGVAVVAGQEVLAIDIAAGKLSYLAPVGAGGAQSFTFQVRDDGGTAGCGGADLDATPNTITFAVPVPGAISGTVLEDGNNDDIGDTPIPGVTVTLQDSSGKVVATTTTDGSGNYVFNGLPPGSYTVVETNKPGYLDVSDKDGGNPNSIAVTVVSGATSTGNSFVDERPAVLGDRVWEDTNANGVQDAGEAGLANVVVQLRDASGTVVQSTTTGADGKYSFSVMPGTYSVVVVKPAGYEVSGQDLGGNDATDSDINGAGQSGLVSLVSGQNNPDVDAGFYKLAELGDRVWYDSNANGVQDAGEAGVQGVKVSLLDAAGNVVASQNTDAAGNYLFSGLKPGTYSVQFDKTTLPAGYGFTTRDAAAATDGSDSDADAATGKTIQTVLQSGESDRSWDAGIVATPGAITGTVREDLDNNNTGDAPIAGVTVVLKDSAGGIVASTTTDASGNYVFNNIPAGNYTVEETNKPGYLDVSDKDGGNPNSIAVTVVSGATSTGNDFVDERTAALGDKVWLDKNANGVQDAGEAGLAGVTVKLIDAGGSVVGTTTTGADGSYLFNNLAPGDYSAQVVAPTGYFLSGKDQGGNDAADSDFDPLTGKTGVVRLSAGETDLSVDAGLYQKASIGDRVWSDSNGNGIQDAGEAGIPGATVKLLDASGNVVATTQTDANGNYLFKDLTPGSYAVQFTAPAGCGFTIKDAGGNDAVDSDVGVTLGTTNLICNGSFESGASGWCGMGDSVEVSTATSFGVSGASGSYVAELDANKTGTVTGFYQDVTTVAGQSYQLSVDLAQRAGTAASTNTVEIWWEGSKIATVDPSSTTLTKYTFTVTAADASSRLEFREQAGDDDSLGGIIDNVKLVTVSGTSVQTTVQTLLESGENDMSWDAGIYCPPAPPPAVASLGDKVWEDLNYNGIQDAGEAGIAGVTVKLLNSAGTVVATTTTNSSGDYLFSNLSSGDYKVQVVAPSGYYYTKQNQGANDATDSDVDGTGKTVLTTLASGENDLSWDAGLYRKASVGDRVWTDWNSNGLQDSGDGGIVNCTVKLLNASGTVIATTTSDSNGNYKFTNLDPSQYSLSFDKSSAYYYTGQYDWYGNPTVSYVSSSNWQFTTKDVYSNSYDTRDSDVSRVSSTYFNQGYTDKFTLVSGQYDSTRDAGVSPIAIDLDGNGIQTIARENTNGTFDLFGTGTAVKSGWLSSSDAFLVVDSNGNGRIDDVGEMFGGNSAGLGFAKLASFDSNGDGLVDSQDARFAELKVWRDANSNQLTDQGELLSLSDAGLASLKVSYVALPAIDEQGNLHLERSSATLVNGDSVDMTDVYFNVSAEDAAAAGVALPDMASLLGNDQSLGCMLGQAIPPGGPFAAAALAGDGGLAGLTQLINLYDDQQPLLMAA
ncbi:SdrD B-like domain-containing protein [Zoogloea sp.]|uniref:SdrD B-like domain-containing protein n=1 Tax=Zoogloea sp. TaxID=49181 RepID=UPI0014161534|nr:MAG: hypothetical protein F9K15_20685 [Zoogloea sp.]